MEKKFNIVGEINRPNGRSIYQCICPFCKNTLEIQKRSFTAVGKKCTCGAVLRNMVARK